MFLFAVILFSDRRFFVSAAVERNTTSFGRVFTIDKKTMTHSKRKLKDLPFGNFILVFYNVCLYNRTTI